MSEQQKRSWWGIGSVALYLGFVIFVLALVLYASVQDFQLSEDGYYEAGLDYQERIDRIKRSRALEQPLRIEHRPAEGRIVLTFPTVANGEQVSGEIRLLRASNARLDRTWSVAPDADGLQVISTSGLARGSWQIQVEWRVDTVGYYNDQRVYIP